MLLLEILAWKDWDWSYDSARERASGPPLQEEKKAVLNILGNSSFMNQSKNTILVENITCYYTIGPIDK